MSFLNNWNKRKPSNTLVSEDISLDKIIENLSESSQLLIFKVSPRCSMSLMIENIFDEWYKENMNDNLKYVKINVIRQRSLSNMIAERYKITHESPQLIWLDYNEKVIWHGSHYSITTDELNNVLSGQLK